LIHRLTIENALTHAGIVIGSQLFADEAAKEERARVGIAYGVRGPAGAVD
jgi:hypothetical protein